MNLTDISNTQNQMVIPYGCITYYSLNEGTGNIAHDFSGNNNNGTITLTSTWIAGRFGNGLWTNGSTASIICSIAIPVNFTVVFWSNFPLNVGTYKTMIDANSTGNQNAIVIVDSNVLGVYDNDHGSNFNSSGYNVGSLSGWHHIAAVGIDSTHIQFYVDGASVGTSSNNSSRSINNIGNFSANSQQWGKFDDVRVYSRSLSAAEIGILYSTT